MAFAGAGLDGVQLREAHLQDPLRRQGAFQPVRRPGKIAGTGNGDALRLRRDGAQLRDARVQLRDFHVDPFAVVLADAAAQDHRLQGFLRRAGLGKLLRVDVLRLLHQQGFDLQVQRRVVPAAEILGGVVEMGELALELQKLLPLRPFLRRPVSRGDRLPGADALSLGKLADDDGLFGGEQLLGTHHKAGNGLPVADFAAHRRGQGVAASGAEKHREKHIRQHDRRKYNRYDF